VFVDHIRIFARAGDGGNGVPHFRREKFEPRGGPDGGDGGRGGDVVLEVHENTDNLRDFFYKSRLLATSGLHGGMRRRAGKSGRTLVAKVPPGTVIYRLEGDEPGVGSVHDLEKELIADLVEPGERIVLCAGGDGGKGNWHFKSSTNRSPIEFTEGTPGEQGWFFLELRRIADAGLVGFPNAGKSTLLGALSSAKPKVAAYPFTTLQPMIGVLDFPGFHRATVADIPGLIEGAHRDVGLGHDFLRHIMRCSLLLFVIDMASLEGRDPISDLQTLRKEIKLHDEGLAKHPWMVIANKMDVEGSEENLAMFRTRFPNLEILPISATEGTGLPELRGRLSEMVGQRPA